MCEDLSVVSDARGQDLRTKSALGPTQCIMASPISKENYKDMASTEGNNQFVAVIEEDCGENILINNDGGSVNGPTISQNQNLKAVEEGVLLTNPITETIVVVDNQVGLPNKVNGPIACDQSGPVEKDLHEFTNLRIISEREQGECLGQNSEISGLGPTLTTCGVRPAGEAEPLSEPYMENGVFSIEKETDLRVEKGVSSI